MTPSMSKTTASSRSTGSSTRGVSGLTTMLFTTNPPLHCAAASSVGLVTGASQRQRSRSDGQRPGGTYGPVPVAGRAASSYPRGGDDRPARTGSDDGHADGHAAADGADAP